MNQLTTLKLKIIYKPLNFKHLHKQQNYSPSTTAKNIELWTANKIIHRPQLEKKWSYGWRINKKHIYLPYKKDEYE
jgi:hypothetical protein